MCFGGGGPKIEKQAPANSGLRLACISNRCVISRHS